MEGVTSFFFFSDSFILMGKKNAPQIVMSRVRLLYTLTVWTCIQNFAGFIYVCVCLSVDKIGSGYLSGVQGWI